jgi:hypothetical protein
MKALKNRKTASVLTLLEQFRASGDKPFNAQKLSFEGTGGKDVYNITAPFLDGGEKVIAGRVEERHSEQAQTVFFVERDGRWVPRENAPVFALQDPFYTFISGELVFGGVEIFPHPTEIGKLGWRTILYRGESVARLQPFFTGPDQMKDLRVVQLQDGTIGVFTRPQGEKGGRGKIGFTRINSLDDLSLEVIDQAPILDGQFLDHEWGGANEIHLLKGGLLGVLGHIARFDEEGNRHYYPMIFVLDPATGEYSDLRIISERSNFQDGPAKRKDLRNVVFSGGLIRHPDGTADLYAGISDAEAHKITIRDPFMAYEK